jgi:hypothetical protein
LRVAIVGACLINPEERRSITKSIKMILNNYMIKNDMLTVVSGGADGVDTIAEEVAKEYKLDTLVFPAEVTQWEDEGDKKGFKTRNTQIAKNCDVLYCFPRVRKDKDCYHCNSSEHQVGGGCWTAKKAKELGKIISIIPPTNYA